MKKIAYLIFSVFLIIGLGSCGIEKFNDHFARSSNKKFTSVKIETLIEDSTLNVRALEIADNKLWFSSSIGLVGFQTIDEQNIIKSLVFNHLYESDVLSYSTRIKKTDSTFLNIRSLAKINDALFILSIESPAMLYKFEKGEIDLVYQENNPKAFYDAMEFWNNQEGIAIGDPTNDCMSVIITRDGGETWTKLPCDDLPKAKEGEAAFAASDTNIAIVGDNTWVATGGKASRILFSPDKGHTWDVYDTPIVQGLETTGMYSLDFYDEQNGFAIGGDYTKADDNAANKIKTIDGGKTWQLVAENENPGYRSCVQYVPNSNAQQLVAIGFKGIDYSIDAGHTWTHLSDEGFYTLRFVNDSVAYAAGSKRISKLTFK